MTKLFQNTSYGIAMRYHVALAMLRAGVPTKLIAYDDKVAGLAKEADVNLLSENNISDFKIAQPGFDEDNQYRFSQMQKAFAQFTN